MITFRAPCPCCGKDAQWRAVPSDASYIGGYSGNVRYTITCPADERRLPVTTRAA